MNRLTLFVAKAEAPTPSCHSVMEAVQRHVAGRGLTTTGTFCDDRIGILTMTARAPLGGDFVHLETRDTTVSVAEGYLYNAAEISKSVGCVDQPLTDAKAMALSIDHRAATVTELWRGHFTAARYDRRSGHTILVTDRYGMKPLYFAETPAFLVYSHDLKLLVDCFPVPRRLDRIAAAQLISLELIFDDRTLLENVTRIPHGTVITIKHGKPRLRQYWDYPFHEQQPLTDVREILAAADFYIDRAVRTELSKAPDRTALALSGGLDSRTILAYAYRHGDSRLGTFTVGVDSFRSPEPRHARQAADAVGAPWDFDDQRDSLDVSQLWPEFVVWTGGWQSVNQSWMHPAYRRLSRLRSYSRVLNGYAFDAQFTFNSRLATARPMTHEEVVTDLLTRYGNVAVHPELRRKLFTPAFGSDISALLKQELQRRLRHLSGALPSEVSDYFIWTARVKSYTAADANIHRKVVSIGMPFLDYDVFDLCMRIPAELKTDRRLYFQLLQEQLGPTLMSVPYSATGVPIGRNPRLRHWLKSATNRAAYLAARMSHGRLEAPAISAAAWLRHDRAFRASVMSLMRAGHLVDAGLLRPSAFKDLLAGIDAGKDYLYDILAPAITVELCIANILEH
jgi:asparagine synthetase B (glutamine-hydrolysing)